MAKKKVVYTPEKDYVYYENEVTPADPEYNRPSGYKTPAERAAMMRAANEAASDPAAIATAQAAANRAAAEAPDRFGVYRSPEERAAQHQAAIKAAEAATTEPLNPYPLGDVDPIYQKDTAGQTAAGTAAAGGGAGATTATKQITTDEVLNKILNGDGFRYNLAADPTFQQLAAAARKEAKLEKADTLAHQTAMTGGYGNTWAQAAAERAYDARMQQLYDQVPALEAAAYDRYRDERADLKDQYSILAARDAAANEEAWREREFEYQQYRDKVGDDQWAQEFGLRADAQAWAQHMDELNFTLAEAEYYLQEKVELGQLSLAQAEQALAELKFAHDQQMDYIAADQNQQKINNDAYFDQQKINLDWADLNSHIDGSYYANNGGGGSPSGSTTTDKTLLQIFNNKPDALDAAVDEAFNKLRNPSVTRDQLEDFLYYKYGEDVGLRILALAEQRSDEMNNDFRRR